MTSYVHVHVTAEQSAPPALCCYWGNYVYPRMTSESLYIKSTSYLATSFDTVPVVSGMTEPRGASFLLVPVHVIVVIGCHLGLISDI